MLLKGIFQNSNNNKECMYSEDESEGHVRNSMNKLYKNNNLHAFEDNKETYKRN